MDKVNVSSPERESAPTAGSRSEFLRLVHHHPGYVRVQADSLIQTMDEASAMTAAQAEVEAISGVRSWLYNPKTGSVVIEYDPEIVDVDDLLKHIANHLGLSGVENATNHKKNRQELVGEFINTVQNVNQVVSEMTGDRADLRELVPVALAATSVVSFILNDDRGRLPDWNNALYHSYRIFMQWHRKDVRTRERVAQQKEENGSAQ